MTAVLEQPPLRSADRRERALSSHLDRLRELCLSDVAAIALDTESGPLKLSGWARSQLRKFFALEGAGAGDEVGAVAHGVALLAKCMDDQGRYAKVDESSIRERFTLQAELMLDTALGMAILRETHQAVDDAVAHGQTEQARRLSAFHHRLRSAVREVRHNIAASEIERADLLADNLTDEPRKEEVKLAPVTSMTRSVPTAAPARTKTWRKIVALRSRAKEEGVWFPSRTELLVAGLALSVAILAAARLPAALAPEVATISVSDFADRPAVVAAKSRPASLYVTVDADAWTSLESTSRRDLVSTVGNLASHRGYEGALIATTDGRSVGRWLANRGFEVLEMPELPAPPTAERHSRFRWSTAPASADP